MTAATTPGPCARCSRAEGTTFDGSRWLCSWCRPRPDPLAASWPAPGGARAPAPTPTPAARPANPPAAPPAPVAPPATSSAAYPAAYPVPAGPVPASLEGLTVGPFLAAAAAAVYETAEALHAAELARDERDYLEAERDRAAPAPAPPAAPKAKPTKPARTRGAAWSPLAPPLPDTPWRVTRDVHVRTLSPNRIMSEHWKSRATRRGREHKAVREAFRGAELPAIDRGLIVTMTRVASVLCDDDRLAGALYACRDATADLYGVDDSHRSGIAFVYRQHVERAREDYKIAARPARAGNPNAGIVARAFRSAREAWRYRSYLRIEIASAVEPAAGPFGATCAPGQPAIGAPTLPPECRSWGPRRCPVA